MKEIKKNILITGASGNLGKASIEKFLSEGYHVIATVTPGKRPPFENSNEISTYEADLTDEDSVNKVVDNIIAQHKTIDVALLLVGSFAQGPISETTGNSLKKMFSLNFETAFFTAREVFQQMTTQKNGGRIVLIGSRPALIANEGKRNVAYALSKSLVFKLAELLNAEGKDKNVVTSVVVPSTIDTPENRVAMPNATFSNWVSPEEIAESMHYLVSEKGSALRDPVLKLYGKS